MSIEEQIKTLKKERQAIILAHNYTMAEVQEKISLKNTEMF